MIKGILWVLVIAALAALATAVTYEVQTSHLQAKLFSRYAGEMTYTLEVGPSDAIVFPAAGPYNERQGYTSIPSFTARLLKRGFEIRQQAHFSDTMLEYVTLGGNAPYREKQQSGLSVRDGADQLVYQTRQPERVYGHFNDIPPLLVDTLLFIENRELLNDTHPTRNPALEWDRLGKVLYAHAVSLVRPHQDTAGASTLATQLEKFRYSPGGLTTDVEEKLRQMVSASIRAYQDGPDTSAARRRIVRDYINSTPLAGRVGFGEIQGVGEGLWAWYGIDFDTANRVLGLAPDEAVLEERARVYKAALSLLLSQRRPSYYLLAGREELASLTDSYLRVLGNAGVIDARLRDAALAQPLIFREGAPMMDSPSFIRQKAVNSVRTELLSLLGINSLYALDRLDLEVKTTVASEVQQAVADTLEKLVDPEHARAMGLIGERLLRENQLSAVRFSVLLYESTPDGNKLRVQTDNLNMPFDLNDGSMLDLGSTAKLRTLVTYLQVVETLYRRHRQQAVAPADVANDPLRLWVADYLRQHPRAALPDILAAAMARRYSASPWELFFTASGQHRFHNFESRDNNRVMSVSEAFNRSVNLVFIRMMRDITRFYINEIPGVHDLLENRDNPLRREYLARFADQEGKEYLGRFHGVYRGKTGDQLIATLAQRTRAVPYRLAMAFRSVRPDANNEAMAAFMASRLGAEMLDDDEVAALYEKYGRDKFNSNDRAYLAGVHPLELWLVEYLLANPGAPLEELTTASSDARQEAYTWLFKTKSWNKQQKRIRILIEQDAFAAIHREWRKLGYPFPSLVPSYATALGASADRPAALSELMGIIVNDGLRLPMSQIETVRFGADTPYETFMVAVPKVGEQVLSSEVAQTLRSALVGIVESGTGRRLSGVFVAPDGTPLAVGGKTGTGDHRSKRMAAGGRVISETVINRNAIFTFFIDDRFFGTILANVGGAEARNFQFTSGLAAQLLKALEPSLQPLLYDDPQWLADNAQAASQEVSALAR